MTWPADVHTLAIDVGGSGIKAAVLDSAGGMRSERTRVATPYPCPPAVLLQTLHDVAASQPPADRVTVGFPGLVRGGVVRMVTALSRTEYGGPTDPHLVAQWNGFDLAAAVEATFDRPALVMNDADIQGCAVVQGEGMEFVLTLGTGAGTALFFNGHLVPHLELGHAPLRKGQTVEEQIGNVARKAVGNEEWAHRVLLAIAAYQRYLYFDRLYLGGGNAKHVPAASLPANVEVVPNSAGITGGARVWDLL